MKRDRVRRGLTLIELMIAVLVLSFGILTAGAMYSSSALLRSRSGTYSRASAIALRKLEQFRRLPAAQITPTVLQSQSIIDTVAPGTSPESYSFTTSDAVANDLPRGTGALRLSGVGTDLVTITVTINWTGMRGKAESMTATTYVADKTAWKG